MKWTLASLLLPASLCMAAETNVTIAIKDSPALVLTVPKTPQITTRNEMTKIQTEDVTLYVWSLPSAKTVAEGVAQIAEVIKGEVVKFAPSATNSLQVAGGEAKHVMGSGVEADDDDPGTADVVVFKAGKAVFAACVHGEGNQAAVERKPMLAILKTAKAP